MSKLKILQILPALEQGGVERGVVEMNRVIVGAGWENVVVSVGGRLVGQIESDGGRHVELDVKSKNPLTFFPRAAVLRKLLVAERPDVVCVHSRVPAWIFRFANRRLSIPWISFAHGANSIGWYSRVMTAGDLVVTPSHYIADYLKSSYGTPEEKLRVIPRAIEAKRFDPARLDTDFISSKRVEWHTEGFKIVMGVGRITQLKGYDVLIHAMGEMRKIPGLPPCKLVIVGEAEELRAVYADGLKTLVAELGLGDYVVFAGNQRKIAECLSIADVVVSSNWKKPEAFGRSMIEALAMNRPVVATAFGGALDIVKDGVNGALVPVQPVGSSVTQIAVPFAKAIASVLTREHDDLRTPALEKFSFARMAEASLSVYRELVERKRK